MNIWSAKGRARSLTHPILSLAGVRVREELLDKGGRKLSLRRSAQGAWALLRARGRILPERGQQAPKREAKGDRKALFLQLFQDLVLWAEASLELFPEKHRVGSAGWGRHGPEPCCEFAVFQPGLSS